MFTRARNLSLCWANESSPHPYPMFLRSILILSSRRPSGFFPSVFSATVYFAFLISPTHTTCPSHVTLLDLIILIMFFEEYKPHCGVCFSLLSPHPCHLQISSSAPSICVLPSTWETVFHAPYKVVGNIVIYCILIFAFEDNKREDELLNAR